MPKYECPEKIYKYMPLDGLIKTLDNGTFKLSRPTSFNDPLDMYLQEGLGSSTEEFLESLKQAFHDFISSDVKHDALQNPKYKNMIVLMNEAMKKAGVEGRKVLRQELISTPVTEIYDVPRLKRLNDQVVTYVNESFKYDAVFCSTVDNSNLLMWAHYADKHKGAVLEFTPNREKDSVFLASRRVAYSDARPLLYRNPQDMIMHGLAMSPEESIKKIVNDLVFVKSSEWAYEQEYRLFVPFLIKEGQDFATLKYHSDELSAIYLGCRMGGDTAAAIYNKVMAINSNAKIYVSSLSPREYKLHFAEYK
jgi:hypothetical protein